MYLLAFCTSYDEIKGVLYIIIIIIIIINI